MADQQPPTDPRNEVVDVSLELVNREALEALTTQLDRIVDLVQSVNATTEGGRLQAARNLGTGGTTTRGRVESRVRPGPSQPPDVLAAADSVRQRMRETAPHQVVSEAAANVQNAAAQTAAQASQPPPPPPPRRPDAPAAPDDPEPRRQPNDETIARRLLRAAHIARREGIGAGVDDWIAASGDLQESAAPGFGGMGLRTTVRPPRARATEGTGAVAAAINNAASSLGGRGQPSGAASNPDEHVDPRGNPLMTSAVPESSNLHRILERIPQERLNERVVQWPGADLTAQQKLGWVSDALLRSGMRAAEREPKNENAGLNRGRAGYLIGQAADNWAIVSSVHRSLMNNLDRTNLRGFLQQRAMIAEGSAMGFDPSGGDMTFPGTRYGMRIPFAPLTEAGREGLRMQAQRFQLAMLPGIGREQAGEIVNSLAGQGWSGQEASTLGQHLVAPLVQQGQQPGTVAGLMDQAMRQGNTSLRQFRETMDHVGDAARTARMSLDEFQQGMGEFAQAATNQGATFGRGLQNAREFTEATGMAPQVGAAMMQNQTVQALAMTNYGMIPQEMGLLPGGALGNVTNQTIEMGLRMAGGYRNQPVTETIDGNRVQIASGAERQAATAAAITGIPVDQIRRFQRDGHRIQAASRARDLLREHERDTRRHHARSRSDRTEAALREASDIPVLGGAVAKMGGKIAGLFGHDDSYDDDRLETDRSDPNLVSWQEVQKQMRAIDPKDTDWQKRINEIGHKHGRDRIREAQKAIGEKTKVETDTKTGDKGPRKVEVEFTGFAEKVLKQAMGTNDGGKHGALSGGISTVAHAVVPGGVVIDAARSLFG
jgi:hypothetical protein